MSKVIFNKQYSGESICDVDRDVSEAFQEDYNSLVKDIPCHEGNIQKGIFTVTITWSEE